MARAVGKAERLLQIEALLLAHPEGLTQAEIARRLEVHRSTIHRYLPDLDRFAVYETDDGRLAIDRDHYLTQVRFTLHEAMALHLAARMMATRTDRHNPHAASALRKLGIALEKLAPLISEHLKRSADVMDEAARRDDPVYMQVLETLTRAWSERRKVRIWHWHEETKQVYEYVFAPYFIEPYPVGRTTHVIGWREPPGALRTFKIERIRRIEKLDESYEIAPDFDPRQHLADAWGIWYTEREPVEVVLRFHPRVAHRVRETRWHRSEQVKEQPDGSLLWRARVAEPQEMLPWIRGWGADVEVIAPEELRDALMNEVQRMADLYGIQPIPTYQRLWAKADKGKARTHPLICHMLDVAVVALALWDEALTAGLRDQIATSMGLGVGEAGRFLALLAGLHDIGKASPAFQRLYSPAVKPLERDGLPFPRQFTAKHPPHGTISAHVLGDLLEAEIGLPRRPARRLARSVGGHHGAWPSSLALQRLLSKQVGGEGWDEVRRDLVRAMTQQLKPPAVKGLETSPKKEQAVLTLLSGLTTVADWIGSMERFFPYVDPPVDLDRYTEQAEEQAREALKALGWLGWQPPAEPASFDRLFQLKPRPMQQAVVELAKRLNRPALVIIEAPTGSGKTEAALYLADHWARVLQQRGLYVAMPTMATSNQIFRRVKEVLVRRYPDRLVNLHLVHSQARWSEEVETLLLETTDELEEGDEGKVAALTWFLPRKRTLLAPFGVGTVDQALLSVLQTRHFFVRLFGLSHKTVVFDEVHAYDTYMSTLFRRLLTWLRAVGASVVILSATLPARARRELLRAYAGVSEVPEVSYPAITWAMEGEIGVVPLEATDGRTIALEWVEREPEALARRLAEELREGGCAAVLCNTVRRAQEVYRAIKEARIVPEEDLILFHARYPSAWRDEIERKVLDRFGKDGKRPAKAIVVATQVIEQSLDLDFDLMITDLAPADLLLQRAGRLHRHPREGRPAPLTAPRLLIARPDVQDGVPHFGPDAYVYEPYVLLRTFLALQRRKGLVLPQDTEPLIEAVYGDEDGLPSDLPDRIADALEEARQRMEKHYQEGVYEAQKRLIPPPDDEGLLASTTALLEEENPEVHRAFQALTRSGPPGLPVVCLHRTAVGLTLEPDGSGPAVDLDQEPDRGLTRLVGQYTLRITHQGVVQHLLKQPGPSGWRDHPLLRHHRVLIFEDGLCSLPDTRYALRLSRELGLTIEKEVE